MAQSESVYGLCFHGVHANGGRKKKSRCWSLGVLFRCFIMCGGRLLLAVAYIPFVYQVSEGSAHPL